MDDKVKYWIDLAENDLAAAKWLISGNMLLHAAFNCHQAVEKAIKAVIARDLPEGEMPPKIHHLIRLASDASIMNTLDLLGK
jgi:HEPN domain-containing protein